MLWRACTAYDEELLLVRSLWGQHRWARHSVARPSVETFLTWSCCGGSLALVNDKEVSGFQWNVVDIVSFMVGVHSERAARRGRRRKIADGLLILRGLCAPMSPSFPLMGHEVLPRPTQSKSRGGGRLR